MEHRTASNMALGAFAASTAVVVGAFLPWQQVGFEGRGGQLGVGRVGGFDLGWDARVCVWLGVAGVVAGWMIAAGSWRSVAVAAKLVLLGSGLATLVTAWLYGEKLQSVVRPLGLSTRFDVGLVAIIAGAVGLILVGAFAPWRPVQRGV